jgi:type I restriction enzyme S subunit
MLVTSIAGSPTSIGNAALTDRRVAFNQQINAVTPCMDVVPLFLHGLSLVTKPLVQRSTTLAMKRVTSRSNVE